MNFEVDLTAHVPIYSQLIDQIKHAIAAGELKPGDQLPTVRQMAADLRVNFNTVARAYRMLDEDGIISTQHGRGTFILEPGSPENTERLRHQRLARLARTFAAQAHKLGFSPDEARRVFEDTLNAWSAAGEPPEDN
ncbi:MAG: GntR family transcriptional regulator [Chloroflexi bacterium]|nr:GntR family transcriptional regulator [Chloroflexota bacterium]